MKYQIQTKAKINLTLDVVSKRDDGYHNLSMIMHSVNLYDKITFYEANHKQINIKNNIPYLPCDERNIIYKAIKLFYEKSNLSFNGFDVKVNKVIPVAAGLAGGSTNAAGVLKFLNSYYNNYFPIEKLLEIGKQLGADVPYCIKSGTYLAEGIGDVLTKLKDMPPCHFVVARPNNKGLSTKQIFSMINIEKMKFHPDTTGMIEAINNRDLKGICHRLYNALEPYSIELSPEIEFYKNLFVANGALGSLMSGSGNACFGIFDDLEKATYCKNKFREFTSQSFVC